MNRSGKRAYQGRGDIYPSKRTKAVLKWWQTGVIYQVYPRSFQDTTNNGTGDINGIIKKADYLSELGIKAIWLSPIYTSPMADFGYDVADFKNIDPVFGTLREFDNLIKEMHQRDIRVVMDFIPNHTSDEHRWFQRSCEREDPYTDYYIWRPAKGVDEHGLHIPPNNWLSVFGGSAWTWCEERQEFYLHQFLEKQPDLNYRNPNVVEEMEDVLKFWLDKGVDGFRVDAIKHLFETENMDENEPLAENTSSITPNQYEYLNHTLTVNRPEIFQVLKGWRQILDQYLDRLLMVEVFDGDINVVMKYYGDAHSDTLAHFPFNFHLITDITSRSQLTGMKLKETIDLWMDNLPDGKWPNWVLGNHDNGRVASRFGSDTVDALHMVVFLLPGTPITYYGEEIGMTNTEISYEDTRDPYGCNFGPERYKQFSRDPSRTPMQWDNTKFAGFTKGSSTWLPVNTNYKDVNVESDGRSRQSHLKVYKKLIQLRQEEAFTKGSLSFPFCTRNLIAFIRNYGDQQRYMVVMNTSQDTVTADLIQKSSEFIPQLGKIILRSSEDSRIETQVGTEIEMNNVSLYSGEGLVLRLLPAETSDDEGEN